MRVFAFIRCLLKCKIVFCLKILFLFVDGLLEAEDGVGGGVAGPGGLVGLHPGGVQLRLLIHALQGSTGW